MLHYIKMKRGDRYWKEIAVELSEFASFTITGKQVKDRIDTLGLNQIDRLGFTADWSAVDLLVNRTVDQFKDQYTEEIAREKALVGDSFNTTKFVREKLWGKDDDGTGLIRKTPIQLWEQFESTKDTDMHIVFFMAALGQIEHKAPKVAFTTDPDHSDYKEDQEKCWNSDNLALKWHDYNKLKSSHLLGDDTRGDIAEKVKQRVAEKETKLNAERQVAIIENRIMESPMLTLLLNGKSKKDIAGLKNLMTLACQQVCDDNDWEFNDTTNDSVDDADDDDVEMKPRKYTGSRKSEGTATNLSVDNFQPKGVIAISPSTAKSLSSISEAVKFAHARSSNKGLRTEKQTGHLLKKHLRNKEAGPFDDTGLRFFDISDGQLDPELFDHIGDDNEELINQIEELHGIIEALESSSNGSSNSGDVGRGVLISRLKDTLLEIESLKRNVVYLHANNLEQARTIDSLSGQLDEYHERVESMDVEKAVISDVATVQLNESRRICGALEQEVHALESQREQHQVEMNELQQRLDMSTANVTALRSERDRLQMEVHAKTSVIEELSKHKDDSKELNELKKEVAELTNQMEGLNSQLKLQESMHKDKMREMTLDHEILSNTQEGTENELRELKALYEGNLARLRVEEERTETNRNELRRNKKKIEDQTSTISSLEEQHRNLMTSKIKDDDEAEKTIHELRVKCLMLEPERDNLLKSNADYETQVTTLEAKVLSTQNEAQRQLQSSLDENHEVQRQLQSIQDEKAAVEQQFKSFQDDNEVLQRQLDTAKSSQSEMQLQLESSQAVEAQKQQELETSQAKNIKSQQQLEASRSELQRQLDSSQDETNKLQSLLESSKAENQTLESKRGALSNEVDKLTSERDQLEVNFKQQLNSCREEKAVLQEQLDTSKVENKHSQQQFESSQDEVKDLQQQFNQLEIKYHESSQELEISRQEKELLQRRLHTAESSQSELQIENDKLQVQLQSSHSSQQQLEAMIRELKQTLATSQKENETMQAKFEKESTNQQLEIKIKELQVKYDELETKNADQQECLEYEKKLCNFTIKRKGVLEAEKNTIVNSLEELRNVNQDLESTIETNNNRLATAETELNTKETVLKSMTTEAHALQKDHISSKLLETDLNKINENNRIEAQRITVPKGDFALLELRRECKRRREERSIDDNEIDLDDDDDLTL